MGPTEPYYILILLPRSEESKHPALNKLLRPERILFMNIYPFKKGPAYR